MCSPILEMGPSSEDSAETSDAPVSGTQEWFAHLLGGFSYRCTIGRDIYVAREAQLRVVDHFVKQGHGFRILYGSPGTGKTQLTQLVAEELRRTGNWAVSYVDGGLDEAPAVILDKITQQLGLVRETTKDEYQYGPMVLFDKGYAGECAGGQENLMNVIDLMCKPEHVSAASHQRPKHFFVVLDEIHCLNKRSLSMLMQIREKAIAPGSRLAVIAISNAPVKQLKLPGKKVPAKECIPFQPYTSAEMQAIIDARCRERGVSSDEFLAPTTKRLVATVSVAPTTEGISRAGGDCRRLLRNMESVIISKSKDCSSSSSEPSPGGLSESDSSIPSPQLAPTPDSRKRDASEALTPDSSSSQSRDGPSPAPRKVRRVEPATIKEAQEAMGMKVEMHMLRSILRSLPRPTLLMIAGVVVARVAARRKGRKDATVLGMTQAAQMLNLKVFQDRAFFHHIGRGFNGQITADMMYRALLDAKTRMPILMVDGKPAGSALKGVTLDSLHRCPADAIDPASRKPLTPAGLMRLFKSLSDPTALSEGEKHVCADFKALSAAMQKYAVSVCPNDNM